MIKKICLFIGLLLPTINFLLAQNLVPFKADNGKWGYKDQQFDDIVITPNYDYATDFSEGLAVVANFSLTKLHRFGFIDKTGKEIIPLKYSSADKFSEGLAPVKNELGKIVFIDKTGKEVIKTIYTEARSFSNGLAAVLLNKKMGFIDKNGTVVIPIIYEAVKDFEDDCTLAMIDGITVQIDKTGKELPMINEFGYVDRMQKKVVIVPTEFNTGTGFTSDGIAFVTNFKNGNTGAINYKGNFLIPMRYYEIRKLSNGLYAIKENNKVGVTDKKGKILIYPKFKFVLSFTQKLSVAVTENNMFIFLDKSGNETTPPLADYFEFIGELAKVKLNGKYGVINSEGKLVIPAIFEDISINENGLIIVTNSNKKGLFNADGSRITDFIYQYIDNFSNGLAMVDNGNFISRYNFIDKSGKEISIQKYEDVLSFSEGLAAVKLKDLWGFIDRNGKLIVPFKYNKVYSFNEGLAAVKQNDKWGYIDKTGKFILALKYSDATSFIDGFANASINGKWGKIDRKGKEVMPMKYSSILNFENGFALQAQFGKYWYINKNGQNVFNLKFDDAQLFKNGYAWVKLNEKWGCIDTIGKFILKPQFESPGEIAENKVAIKENKKWGYYNLNGQQIIKPTYGIASPFSEGLAAVSYYDWGGYFYIDSTGKRIIEGPFRLADKFNNGIAHVVTQNLQHEYINKKGEKQIKYTKNVQGENLRVTFKYTSNNNNNNSTNKIPKVTPADKKLNYSFTKYYAYSRVSSYSNAVESNYKVVVSRDFIQVYIEGNRGLYSLWNEYKIVASDEMKEPGQAPDLAYLSSNNKMLIFIRKEGRDVLRIGTIEMDSYTEYISEKN